MKKIIFHILTFIMCFNALSQNNDTNAIDPKTFDYSKVDSIALNFPKVKYKTTEELAHALTVGINTEHEKFRVIFRWIADNIEYSWGSRSRDPKQVIKKKKAVCSGYSNLLETLCNYSGIEIKTIAGNAKSYPEHIWLNPKETSHAWSAVKFGANWYLVDVTWAAGGYDLKKKKFYKHYNELWFLTDPKFFVLSHLPKEDKWQLLNPPYRERIFKKSPIYYKGFEKFNIKAIGRLKGKIRNELSVRFSSDVIIKNGLIYFEDTKTFYSPTIIKNDNGTYILKYKFDKHDNGGFLLRLNDELVFGFWKL